MDKPKVYFRADGNSNMGMGHVVRSLALAEMISSVFECHFIIREPLSSIKRQLVQKCKSVIELTSAHTKEEELNFILKFIQSDEIIVLDGYHFDTTYQERLKKNKIKIVCIDDIHTYDFVAHVIINHSGGCTKEDYNAAPDTKLYFGPSYALLRKPFRQAAINKKAKNKNLFICLGGSDPKNDLIRVLKKVEKSGEKEVCYVVIGAAYSHQDKLNGYLNKSSLTVQVLQNLSAKQMVKYMNLCGRAITPPSTVSYEYLSTGGALYLKMIANNQKYMYKYLIDSNLAYSFDRDFGSTKKLSSSKLTQTTSEIFDGKQEKRFINIFNSLSLTIKLAKKNDCELFFLWANDPLTRLQSYNSEPLKYSEHEKWYRDRMRDKNSLLYIISLHNIPIGQVRFQIQESTATISYSVDKDYRGMSLGYWVLKKAIDKMNSIFANITIIGYVKFDNLPSAQIFRKLNFLETTASEVENSYKYILANPNSQHSY